MHVRVLLACFVIGWATSVMQLQAEEPSSAAVALWGLQGFEASDLGVDAGTMTDLDVLLADPADLAAGGAERLAVLPWLGRTHVETLHANPFVHGVDEVASLPGWDLETARSIAPFVRFAASPPRARVHASGRATRTAMRVEFCGPGIDVAAKRPHGEGRAGGAIRARRRGLTLTAGDFRCGFAQGLVAWGASGGARIDDAVLRRTRGFVPGSDPAASRALRGLALEAGAGEWRAFAASAASDAGPARILSCAAPLGAGQWRGTLAAVGATRAASLGYERGQRDRALALEVAGDGRRRVAVAAGAEWRTARLSLGTQLGLSPSGPLTPLATGTRSIGSRHGLLQLRARAAGVHAAVSILRGADESPEGNWSVRDDQQFLLTATGAGSTCELRLRRTTTGTEAWCDAARREWRTTVRTAVRVRARRPLQPGWVLAAEVQRKTVCGSERDRSTGEAWDLRCERTRDRWRAWVGIGIHRVPTGVEMYESLPGSALGTIRLGGDAMRAALGMRVTWGAVDAAGAMWATSSTVAGVRGAARGELTLRVP